MSIKISFPDISNRDIFYLTFTFIYYNLQEDFNDNAWSDRWTVPSKWKSAEDLGAWKHTSGEFFASASDKGVQTSEDARFYGMTAKLDENFTNEGKQIFFLESDANICNAGFRLCSI